MGFQGFITNGQTFVYQEGSLNTSAAFGLDEDNFGRWKLAVSGTVGASPAGTTQIAVDYTTPGFIELTPNGPGGQLYVNDADASVYGAAVSTAANGFNCIKSRNYMVLGAGDTLGYFTFGGFDGTNDIQSAQIISVNPMGSTIGTGRIAGDMSFYTAPDNTNGPTLRVYIPITGGLEIKAPDSGNSLTVDSFGVGVLLSNSSGVISSLTPGISGYVLTSNGVSSAPSWQASTGGVTSISGTANEITASASTGSVTLSIPSTFIAPGSIASTTSITAGNNLTVTTGGLTVTAGNTTLTPLNASGVVFNSSAGLLSTSATTAHAVQIGNSSGQLTSLSVGTNGQVLVGSTSADPVFATLTSSSLSYTTGAGTLAIDISAPVSIANGGTNATSMATTDGVCYFDGTRIVTTAAGTATYVLTSNGAGMAPTFQASAGDVTSISGTANEITASASTGAVTLSTPSTFIAPGSIASTTSITAGNALTVTTGGATITAGGLTVTAGNTTLTPLNATGIVYNSSAGLLSTHATTAHYVEIGNSSGQLSEVAPSATSGVPLISQGSSSDPTFGTAVVAGGGTGVASFTAYAPICGGTTTTGTLQVASTGMSNSGYVLTSTGTSSLPTWQAAGGGGGGISWVDQTSSSVTMAVNTGYVIDNGASKVTATLPSTAALGSIFAIAGFSSGGWRLAQAASQLIHYGSSVTTTGTGGYLEFTNQYDSIEIVCVVANTTFVVRSSIGNITVN